MIYQFLAIPRKIICLSVILFTILSCQKSDEILIEISGDYCTYRESSLGHNSSEVSIVLDTSERFDYIISNISGYNNTSQAFKNIGCDRLNNKLVIPETTVLIGNSDSMFISGEGFISSDGSIKIDIETNTSTNNNDFSLYLSNNASYNYYGAYSATGKNVNLLADKIELEFTTADNKLLHFVIEESENSNCSISVARQSLIEINSNNQYNLELDLFFANNMAFGKLLYTSSSWQNAQSIELELEK